MGKPYSPKGLRISDEVHRALRIRAAETGESMGAIAERALRKELGMVPPEGFVDAVVREFVDVFEEELANVLGCHIRDLPEEARKAVKNDYAHYAAMRRDALNAAVSRLKESGIWPENQEAEVIDEFRKLRREYGY